MLAVIQGDPEIYHRLKQAEVNSGMTSKLDPKQ